MTRTKIICTIGPSVNTPEKIEQLAYAGMDVARLNMSHGTHEEHAKVIKELKAIREKLDQPLAIMLDTKGPEIRLGKMKEPVVLKQGDRLHLVKEELEGDAQRVSVTPPGILDEIKEGMTILFCDGQVRSHVVEIGDGVKVEIDEGGVISSNKGVNIPNTSLSLPAVTEKDIEDIRFGCEQGIDIVAASFVRSADHVHQIKELLTDNIIVVAKIENAEGIDNFDEIVKAADGIMIARGDLGVEVPLARVPSLQKTMIRKCNLEGKPSVTATQMLSSMVDRPVPSRAEASDVANAIFDSTSCVMMSEETAMGKYPLEAIQTMKKIIIEAEKACDYKEFYRFHAEQVYNDITSSLTLATVKMAYSCDAKGIFAFTSSGTTARLLSRIRPSMPIIASTPSKKCYHQMALTWGVKPQLSEGKYGQILEAFAEASRKAVESGFVKKDDQVLITGGSRFPNPGVANMVIIDKVDGYAG